MGRQGSKRRSKSSYRRSAQIREKKLKCMFLIFCNGETEKYYFDGFKRHLNFETIDVELVNCSPENMHEDIRSKVNYKQKTKRRKYNYDVNYSCCVVDCDSFDLRKAIENAGNEGIDLYYSNVCFEVWILLHFRSFSRHYSAKEILKEVEKTFENVPGLKKYDKADKDIYSYLSDKLETAKVNAITQLKSQRDKPPEKANSSTNLYKLIRKLEKLKEEESSLSFLDK